MIVKCGECSMFFEDEYRSTICPHETFAANDGCNNFAHHPEAYRAPESPDARHWRVAKEIMP